MKWIMIAGGAVALLVALMALIGSMLPVKHLAVRKAAFKQSPEAIYSVLAGPSDWRSDVRAVGDLPEKNGRMQWWEQDKHGQKITYELVEASPPTRRVTRIADAGLPFGGTWTIEVAPLAAGGSEVRIAEAGEVYNVFFRFLSRFVFGYTSTIDGYLNDLGKKFGEAVHIEGHIEKELDMGQELDCTLRYRNRTLAGKAYLETAYVLFRGEERLKIAFEDLTGVHAAGGVLRLEFTQGPALLDLGSAAEKWARKILHPPTRMEKLGVKPGLAIAVDGDLEAEFLREIGDVVSAKAKADLLFFAAHKTADLGRIAKLKTRLNPRGGLWVVYPKGVSAIREVEVIAAGRAAGLKDIKVASFSSTHTALRFALPVR